MKDKVLIGVITGLLADVVKLTFNYLAYLLNFASVVFWQITASRFLEKKELHRPIAYLVGAVTDLTVTSVIGALFIYFLHFTGRDYVWLKGAGFGLTFWALLLGTLLQQSHAKLNLVPSDIMVTFFAHLIYGLALAYLAKKLYRLPTSPV
ncbi:MAG: hypothetical protein K6U80_08300 [Firmicutes bacterium]|nr:hypothetical protein [Bacillota bacterium]